MYDFEFESVEHAKEYFMEKYGIDAQFIDLSQAILLKSAVDRFVSLNYQEQGEKVFEGFLIRLL